MCLSALAGYVDAIGFLDLGGFFVSFMSGNSTRAGVGVAMHAAHALTAAGLIASFLTGVIAATLLGQFAPSPHRSRFVLGFVALLLAIAALTGPHWTAAAAMALAMGAVNIVFAAEGDVSFGVTYMTGALVKMGQRIAATLLGRDRFGWLPYLVLWTGLVSGAVAGAMVYPVYGMSALWGAAVAAALIAAFV